LEKELTFDVNNLTKQIEKRGDKAGDSIKTRLLDASYRLQFVQEALGPDSPYQTTLREKELKAAAEAAL
jgi:hypothetical protein